MISSAMYTIDVVFGPGISVCVPWSTGLNQVVEDVTVSRTECHLVHRMMTSREFVLK